MTPFQKVIKYGAIGFGVFLCINIISIMIFGVTILLGVTAGIDIINEGQTSRLEGINYSEKYTNIESLDINVEVSKLTIKVSNEFKVEANNIHSDFYSKVENGTLRIKENRNSPWFNFNVEMSEIKVYVPADVKLEDIKISTGVGKSTLEFLNAENINLELGVGTVNIYNIYSETLKVDSGVGKLEIENANTEKLNLTTGVGENIFKGKVTKSGKIECGIGKTEIELMGNLDDYSVKTETGLGIITIDGQKAHNEQTFGKGNAKIEVEGGVGATYINFVEETNI